MSTILIVGTEIELAERWADTLARLGHDVLRVAHVEDGAARAREGGIDLVVLDPDGPTTTTPLPGASEQNARALVHELERLPDAPPVVLISGSPRAPELSAQLGTAGFLPKPCSTEDLLEIVVRVGNAAVRRPAFDDETTSPRRRF